MAFSSPSSTRARRTAPTRAVQRPSLIRGAVAATAAALLVATGAQPPRAVAAEPLSPEFAGLAQGVDVSKWQHPNGDDIDWKAAAASGRSFTFVKATDGDAPGNEFYEDDVNGARSAGMAVGSYHKAHPGEDATAQAKAFSSTIQKVGGNQLPPVLDIEIDEGLDPGSLVSWIHTFLDETQRQTGRTPIVYTYRNFWLSKTGNSTEFTKYPLWIAEYRVSEPTFPLVGGWSEWTFWQNAGDDGTNPGFPTAVDLDVFAGSTNDLKSLIGPVSPGSGGTKVPAKPTGTTPAAKGDVKVAGSSVPTKLTIPAIPGVKLPPGITLPMTITLPTTSMAGGKTADLVAALRSPQVAALLDKLPPELLKSAQLS